MTENHDAAPVSERLIRQGAQWTTDDYEILVQALRHGCDDTEVAFALGRTPGAVRSRARYLIDPGDRLPGKHLTVLRQILEENPDYDWEPRVRATAAGRGHRYWDRAAVATLRRGWDQKQSLPALAAALDATEHDVVRELLALEMATSTVEAVDRLGATPGGVMDLRARLATDRKNVSVWVLTLTGLIESDGHHVSLHDTRDDAVRVRDQILRDLSVESTDTGAITVAWTIAQRTPGGANTGTSSSGDQLVNI